MKLSERLALHADAWDDWNSEHPPEDRAVEMPALLREAAAMARRMEAGHDVLVTHWEQAAFAVANLPVPSHGSIIRLIPTPPDPDNA